MKETGMSSSTRIMLAILTAGSDESLVQHRVGNLEEARDVRTVHEISGSPVGLRCLVAVLVDRNHDLVQPIIYFFAIPRQPCAVLGHLKSRSCDTTGIRGFGWSVQGAGIQEHLGRLKSAGHVRAFGYELNAVLNQARCVFGVDLVLRGARERTIGFDVPQRIVIQRDIRGHEDGFFELVRILTNAAPTHVLELHDPGQLFAVDAVRIEDYAIRVGQRNWLRSQIEQLLDRILGNVSAPRDQAELALQRVLPRLQHLGGEIDAAISGCFRTNQRTTPIQALACEHTGELIGQALVLSKQKTDLSSPNSDIPRRHIGIGSDVPPQLGHEALAEAHHFIVALTLWIEIRTAFAAAHRQRGQRVLEDLLKCQKFEDSKIHRCVKAQTALVGADCAVHLNAESAIDLHVSLIVEPGHAEHDYAFGFYNSLKNLRGPVFRMLLQHQTQRVEYFPHCLVKLRFGRILRLHLSHNFFNVISRWFDSARGENSGTHSVALL